MKIHQYLTYYLPRLGGVENAVFNINYWLQKRGHDVTVHTTDSLGHGVQQPLAKKETIQGQEILRHRSLSIPLEKLIGKIQTIPFSMDLPLSTLRNNADVVNFYVPHQGIAETNVLAASFKKKKTVLTIYNFEVYKSTLEHVLYKVFDLVTSTAMDAVNAIIVASNLFKQRYFSRMYHDKVHVVPLGVDNSRFNTIHREKYKRNMPYSDTIKIEQKKKNLLFVSVLDNAHEYKGLVWLLQAYKGIARDREDMCLNIVGSGPLKQKYESITKNWNMKGAINYLGRVSDADLDMLYHTSDVFILPSISELEGFGMVALESISSGTPAIVSDICGVSEIVSRLKMGKIISPFGKNVKNSVHHWYERISDRPIETDYIDQISESIYHVLEKDWETHRTNSAEKIKDDYTWEKCAERTEKVYERVK